MKNDQATTRLVTDSHEHKSAMGVRNVVRTTSSRLMPSMPTWYDQAVATAAAAEEHGRQGAGDRQEDEEAQHGKVHRAHTHK